MPARTACLALCSKWFGGPNRNLKKSIRVGRSGIFGSRGSSPISMCLPGFWASSAGPFGMLVSPSARLNRRDFDDDRVELAHHLVLERIGALGQAHRVVHFRILYD